MATHSSIRKSHGEQSLTGHSPLGCKESDMTELTNTFTFRAESRMEKSGECTWKGKGKLSSTFHKKNTVEGL